MTAYVICKPAPLTAAGQVALAAESSNIVAALNAQALSPAQRAWATRQANAAAQVGAIAQVAVHRTARSATIDVAFPNGEAFELFVNAKGAQFKLTGTDRVALSQAVYPHLAAMPSESLRDRIDRIAAAARKSATLAKFVARLAA